jgi:hypothetical protein
LTPKEPQHEKFPKDWDKIIKMLSKNYSKYVQLERDEISKKIPTLVLRYEDLMLRSEETLSQIFRFLLNAPSSKGTVIE